MIDPSLYQLKFFVVWQAFADDLKKIFKNGERDARTLPIAERQEQYMRAILGLAKLLFAIEQRDLGHHFQFLAEALYDLTEGISHPLFKVPKKRGAPPDTSQIWRLRAYLCIGIQYLIASVMEQEKEKEKAINFVVRKYKTQFQRLVRPGSRPKTSLKSSIRAWLREFATDATNNVALEIYKDAMRDLEEMIKASIDVNRLREAGLKWIEQTAIQAAQVPKT
jgi:hypothetical protein